MRVDMVFRAIGSLGIRFRWLALAAWIAGTIAAVTLLPALSSVTQSNNTKFLPASAPSEHAVTLAAPFGTAGLVPIPVVAAESGSRQLTAADQAALTRLQGRLRTVHHVSKVVDLGRSPDGRAEQLVVLAQQAGVSGTNAATLVGSLRSEIAHAGLPAGLRAHLAGNIAVEVDQQHASGSTGNQIQLLSMAFIIVLLVLIFRSLTLALTTIAPAVLAATIAGPLVAEAARHGLQVSPLAQYLMIVLVLGAGTDYGLFLVFRVREELRKTRGEDPDGRIGPREAMREMARDLLRSRPAAAEAIVTSVTRVGESITFSAATVIAAVLTLLVASFPFYSDLGIPFAIAIGVTLVAGLTLLPALLSLRLSMIGVKRTACRLIFGRARPLVALKRAALRRVAGRPQLLGGGTGATDAAGVWGRIAGRIVARPVPTLAIGIAVFGGLAFGVLGYSSSGFSGNTAAPSGSDSAAGNALLTRHFPQAAANPTSLIFRLPRPAWNDSAALVAAAGRLHASGLFTKITGPLNPAGAALSPARYTALHARLGPPASLPPAPPPGTTVPLGMYEAYRATANYVSPDGRTVQYSTALKAGDPAGTPALDAVPSIRATTSSVAASIGATDSAVGGEAPALYDISSVSSNDLARVIPIAILAIGVLLALVLRSLVAPLYLIVSVGLSYFAALGLAVLLFIKIGGGAGLVFFLPFLMFIFLLALGEDYNILVMTRIREEAHTLRLREAVTRALGVTGTTVTSAGLVLAGTFMVFALVAGRQSGGSQFVDIGLGLGFGILMDTFLVRTLLVPSTVVLLGRWNWWPSRLRQHEVPVPSGLPADDVVAAPELP